MKYITTQDEQGIKNRYDDDCAAGHNFLKWVVAPMLAQKYSLKYIYNPIIPEYMSGKWNEFLGFDKDELLQKDINDVLIINLDKLPWDCKWNHPYFQEVFNKDYKTDILFKLAPGQAITFDWNYYLKNNLREKYDFARQQSPLEYKKDNKFIIAVHIRHGDINPKDQPERYIFNQQYLQLFDNIQKCFNKINKTYKIQIISEGEKGDFNPLDQLDNVEFLLNESPYIAFDRMVNADIFIPAKSAFSTLACYLSSGIKFIIPFSVYWRNDFPNNDNFKNIIPVNDNMDFNVKKLLKVIK